jgi:DNA-binding CsgD family transcriptional regulator
MFGKPLSKPRESEIMQLKLTGLQQCEVAEKLGLSPNTVATHMHRIVLKLGGRNPFHALIIYLRKQIAPDLDAFSFEKRARAANVLAGMVPLQTDK